MEDNESSMSPTVGSFRMVLSCRIGRRNLDLLDFVAGLYFTLCAQNVGNVSKKI